MTSIPALPTVPGASPSPASARKNEIAITSASFLTLLVAQLKNQDPLKPTDPGETVQQLASLSQVSGLQDINATLTQLLAGQNTSSDASGWIGRSALVPSTTALPLKDGSYAGEALVKSDAAIDITFTNSAGAVVHTDHIAGPIAGRVSFNWPGLVDGVPVAGPLKITAMAGQTPASIAVWTPVESIRSPAQSVAVIETPLGAFAPTAVLDLK